MTTTTLPQHQARARADYLNIALWTFQGWLSMFFIAAGYAKLTESMENLTVLMTWPALTGEALVRGVGVVEIVLAVLILAPVISWKIGKVPVLIAAAGLLALEIAALLFHAVSLDVGLSLTNVFLIAITAPVLCLRRNLRA
ncbi:DoxX family protein [Brevundimonas diminuta]|uniref:DoxX family protein n=1 Tax=Brevundimonas diminuta TaxID=293 RepID=UPI003D094908